MAAKIINGMSIQEILIGLASDEADSAWDQFLVDYSPLILHIARRHEHDDESIMDCYVFVCEKLADNGFRRLLAFKPDGPASFRTWLAKVAGNLCIDWRRQRYGRRRTLRAIARLPSLERLVFKHLYEIGTTRQECLQALRIHYPDITAQQIGEINGRIHELLSSQQRWRLIARNRATVSLSEALSDHSSNAEPIAPGPDVDEVTASRMDRERLKAAMSQLSHDDRLVLQLRYQRDLTLDEVARLMRFADPSAAHRQIAAALAKLAEYMKN